MADKKFSDFVPPGGTPLDPATALLVAFVTNTDNYKLTVAEMATLLSTKSNYLYNNADPPELVVDAVNQALKTTVGNTTLQWQNGYLFAANGIDIYLSWQDAKAYDENGLSIDWAARQLSLASGVLIDYSNDDAASAALKFKGGRALFNNATDDTSSALQVNGTVLATAFTGGSVNLDLGDFTSDGSGNVTVKKLRTALDGISIEQYDSDLMADVEVLARYRESHGTYPAATFLYGAGTTPTVNIEKTDHTDLTTFNVKATTAVFSGAISTTGNINSADGISVTGGFDADNAGNVTATEFLGGGSGLTALADVADGTYGGTEITEIVITNGRISSITGA